MPSTPRPPQRRTVRTTVAALAVATATVVAVSACGPSVTGSAQPNASALATTTGATTAGTGTSTPATTRTSSTGQRPSASRLTLSTQPTEQSDSTGSSDPTDPGDVTDPTLPTDLGSIPGFTAECGAVTAAYLTIVIAPLSSLSGETYDATELQRGLDDIRGSADVPPELAPDFQALGEVATAASGTSIEQAGELFSSEKFTTASDHISAWVDANCPT